MLLETKSAIIYGAAGAVGGAVARAFAREGARTFLTGRNHSALAVLAEEISAAGGLAETAEVDALNEQAVASHVDTVVDKREPSTCRLTPLVFRSKAFKGSHSQS